MKKCRLTFVVFPIFLLSACANWAPQVTPDHTPDKSSAYLFGNFQVKTITKNSFGQHQSFGLNFTCADGNSYLVRFRITSTLQIIPVKPSKCSLTELVFVDIDGFIKMRRAFTSNFLQSIELKPATAYYIGDYEGEAWTTTSVTKIHYSWRLTSVKDSHSHTTDKLKAEFSKFSDISTNNLLIGAELPPTSPAVLGPG